MKRLAYGCRIEFLSSTFKSFGAFRKGNIVSVSAYMNKFVYLLYLKYFELKSPDKSAKTVWMNRYTRHKPNEVLNNYSQGRKYFSGQTEDEFKECFQLVDHHTYRRTLLMSEFDARHVLWDEQSKHYGKWFDTVGIKWELEKKYPTGGELTQSSRAKPQWVLRSRLFYLSRAERRLSKNFDWTLRCSDHLAVFSQFNITTTAKKNISFRQRKERPQYNIHAQGTLPELHPKYYKLYSGMPIEWAVGDCIL